MKILFDAMDAYHPLNEDTKAALTPLLHTRKVAAKEIYLREDTTPHYISFICSGLFSYYTTTENGGQIIKIFFAENSFMASTSALIRNCPGIFSIRALEDSEVIELDFQAFKKLTEKHIDLAQFWIHYLEKNWVVAKEEGEINLKYLTAKDRYILFQKQFPGLPDRIKLQDIAAYLGVTPTQMSRIRNTQHM